MSWILTFLVFFPAVGALVVMVVPKSLVRIAAAVLSAITFLVSLWLYIGPLIANSGFGNIMHPAWVDRAPWISVNIGTLSLNIQYHLGADGLSIFMLILNALLSFLAIIGSWRVEKRTREYMVLLLILETGVMGVFCAFDLYLFWLFWEVELIPMFLLIAIWGGQRREYAAWKFVIYTIFGSAFMLAGILLLYFSLGTPGQPHTYSAAFEFLATHHVAGSYAIFGGTIASQLVIFLLLYFGFAIKIPMIPFHTWLPDAHTEAPTAVSVLLAGVLLKMGAYGFDPYLYRFRTPRRASVCRPAGRAGGDQRRLWRRLLAGAERHEKDDRLFQRQPHGIHFAWRGGCRRAGCGQSRFPRGGVDGRGDPDVFAWQPSLACSSSAWVSSTNGRTCVKSTRLAACKRPCRA